MPGLKAVVVFLKTSITVQVLRKPILKHLANFLKKAQKSSSWRKHWSQYQLVIGTVGCRNNRISPLDIVGDTIHEFTLKVVLVRCKSDVEKASNYIYL